MVSQLGLLAAVFAQELLAAVFAQELLAAEREPAAAWSALVAGWPLVPERPNHPVAGHCRSAQAEPSRLAMRPSPVPAGRFRLPESARFYWLQQGCPIHRKLPRWTAGIAGHRGSRCRCRCSSCRRIRIRQADPTCCPYRRTPEWQMPRMAARWLRQLREILQQICHVLDESYECLASRCVRPFLRVTAMGMSVSGQSTPLTGRIKSVC